MKRIFINIGMGSKINCPDAFEKKLASQLFPGFQSALFFKVDNLFFPRFLFLLATTFFTACEQESNAELTTETPVVEAYLFAGSPVDSIKVSQSNSYASGDTVISTLDDLQLSLSDGTNVYALEPIGNGIYQNLDVRVEERKNYTLAFDFQNETVTAETYVPMKNEVSISETEISMEKIEQGSFPNLSDIPDPIELSWSNSEGDYYYVLVENLEENPEATNELFASDEFQNRNFSFISEPEVTDFYAINPRREIRQFGRHRIIVYRVNPEYALLYESSGTTSTTIAQPPSNVVNGLGIFTGVSSDTVFLRVNKR